MAINLNGAASGAAAGASFGPWGAAIGGIAGAFLGKQKAAPAATLKPVDVQEEQRKALAGNLANFDSAATLSSKTNSFNQTEANRLLEQALPGFSAIRGKLLAEVDRDLAGGNSLPREVSDNLARVAAERGITRGTSGGFQSFSLLKDFGFNLVDWRNASRARALNTLSTVYGMAPRVNVMSPMSSMVDPNTAISVAGQNNQAQFNADQASLNAQTAAGNFNRSRLAGIVQAAGTLAGSFAGSATPSVQPKATAAPTLAPGTSPLRSGQPGFATTLPRMTGTP
jgi:hypothetical protein